MNCQNCKNPIQKNVTSCEWCGFELVNGINYSNSEINDTINSNLSSKVTIEQSIKVLSPKTKLFIILGFVLLSLGILGLFINKENQRHYNNNVPPILYEETDKEKEIKPEEARVVQFNNFTSRTIFLSISYKINSNWKTFGWFKINPKSSESIELPQSMKENSIYWYAYSSDGMEWNGYERDFIVDKNSKTGFEVLNGIIEVDGMGTKLEKGFNELILENGKTEFNINE